MKTEATFSKIFPVVCAALCAGAFAISRSWSVFWIETDPRERSATDQRSGVWESNRSDPPESDGGLPASFDNLWDRVNPHGGYAEKDVRMLERILRMNADELEDLLTNEKSRVSTGRCGSPWIRAASLRLGEIAPQRATALWSRVCEKHAGLAGNQEWLGLVEHWKQATPARFWAWFRDLPLYLKHSVPPGVLSGLLDPGLHRSLADSVGGSDAWNHFAGMIAFGRNEFENGGRLSEKEMENLPKALDYANSMPSQQSRDGVLQAIANMLAGSEEGRRHIREHPDLQAALAKEIRGSPVWLQFSAIAFKGQTEGVSDPALREAILDYGFRQDAHKDPEKAAQRLDALAGTGDYPAAVRGFVEGASRKDPAAALEWALTIPEGDSQRMEALENAARALYKKAPEEARRWVETAPLSAAEYRRLTGRDRF